jgi:putative Holliday junction resolvase
MKYLGLDFGKKKIGVAISDENGKIAFPKKIIRNSAGVVLQLKKIIVDEGVQGIVVGESNDFQGKENAIMVETKKFAEKLEGATGIRPTYHLEYLSSAEARRIIDNRDDDSRAAAIVLQSFLDAINNK